MVDSGVSAANMCCMRLTLERFGGLRGVPARPLVVDTGGLPEPRAKLIEGLAASVLGESGASQHAPQPDAFGYELTIETGEGRRVISFDYANASDALKQLLKELRA